MQLDSAPQTDPRISRALSRGHLIDITTYGRKTGLPRRIELVFHAVDGRVILSGMPGRVRDWLLNMRANPRVILHLKSIVSADLPATAREIAEPAERRSLMERVAANWGRADVDRMMVDSPLVELLVDGYSPARATPAQPRG
jgi:deazaflavin-dependent oxidoreductase (nitroreductase family)